MDGEHQMGWPVCDDTFTEVGGRHVHVAIIGAGYAGLGLGIQLRRRGYEDFLVLERSNDIGGTWRDNVYPGAGCDVPSHLYSYSFDLNPDWSHTFSRQPEIKQYIDDVADRTGIREKVILGCELTSAQWNGDTGRWVLQTSSGRCTADVLVSAVGPLSEPTLPDIPGLAAFEGEVFHSSRWNRDVDLTGKRVTVIGTGASAVQIIPAIAPHVARLDVYQRTAPWVFPKLLRRYTAIERAALRHIPGLARLYRLFLYCVREIYAVVLIKVPSLSLGLFVIARMKLWLEVRDSELRRKVTPDYRVGCKRMLPSNAYYPSLTRPNVDLVTAEISRIGARSVHTADGATRDTDVIIVATGFHISDSPAFARYIGRDGRSLATVFDEDGCQGYKGCSIVNFPNAFLVPGPNSVLGYSSALFMIESQYNYILDALAVIASRKVQTFEVRPEAHRQYNLRLAAKARHSVWVEGGCRSWFLDRKGRNIVLWPDFSITFRRLLKTFDLDAYHSTTREATQVSVATASGTPTAGPRK